MPSELLKVYTNRLNYGTVVRRDGEREWTKCNVLDIGENVLATPCGLIVTPRKTI